MLLFQLICLNYKGYEVGLGFFSTDNNILWSKRLPGIHSCFNEEEDEITYWQRSKLFEGYVPLNFENATEVNETSTITLCSFKFYKKRYFRQWDKISKELPYLSFHSIYSQVKTDAFTKIDDQIYFYSNYLISIAKGSDLKNTFMNVTSNNPVLINKDSQINFTISIRMSDMEIPIPEARAFPYMQCFVFVLAVIFAVIIRFLIRRRYQSITYLNIVNVWTQNPHISNHLLFSFSGAHLFSTLVLFTILKNDNQSPINTMTVSYVLSTMVSSFLSSLYHYVMKDPCFDPDFMAPCIAPLNFISLFNLATLYVQWIIFGSQISPGILGGATFILAILTTLSISRAIGNAVYMAAPKSWQLKEQFPSKSDKINLRITDILIVVVNVTIQMIFSSKLFYHILEMHINLISLDLTLFWEVVLISGAISVVYAALQTKNDLKSERQFLYTYLIVSAISTIVSVIYQVYLVFFVFRVNILDIFRLVRAVYGVLFNAGFVLFFQMFFTSFTSFFIVISIFRTHEK